MPQTSFLSEILHRAVRAGRLRAAGEDDLGALCDRLIGARGEASGLISAAQILDRFTALDADGRLAFFRDLAARFGVDRKALSAAIAAWNEAREVAEDAPAAEESAARAIHLAAEPRSQELIRRLNRVPGGTARLVAMRAKLIDALDAAPELAGLDSDFRHLFAAWFNRGFLEIRRISWSTAAEILEKIIAYEAVHEITGWSDLRQRVADPDRRLFAFFHPAMPAEPLIFVEVALTEEIPDAIGPILARDREATDPEDATTAVFYSISNCQKGLRGISFGNFLIKQVVEELRREFPGLKRFVTLSPVPGLRRWVARAEAEGDPALPAELASALRKLGADEAPAPDIAAEIAARYLLNAKRGAGAADPVANFHLGNGAILHRIDPEANESPRSLAESWGVMVNYLYDDRSIAANHQAYANEGKIAASSEVSALAAKKRKAAKAG